MQGLEGLPVWLQGVVMIAVFAGAALGAIKAYVKPKRDHADDKDTVVLSATIADGAAVRTLIVSIDRLDASTERMTSALRDVDGRLHENGRKLDGLIDVMGKAAAAPR